MELFNFSFFSISGQGIDLDYHDIEWFALEMNREHFWHLLFDYFQFALILGPNSASSYAVLLFTALNLASITSPIHNWVSFLLWLHPFILSGVISPLISSTILGTH